ncbi:tetratricopeptide repeat protein [Alicyclobacillus herbarius]|uniref:tetratricopeptide repeat protein n=1 Tax=Alicyclobacillus herbarius TaxID=122960 RepID=UPI00047BFF87|nr:tetratricopeptide repeat protein [Alicyclobacillus herbarius]
MFLIWRMLSVVLGNPWLAVLVLVVAYYILDRRYIGLLPSVRKPFRRWRRRAELKRIIADNPHHADARLELAELYMEKKQWSPAQRLLTELPESLRQTPDVQYDEGVCAIGLREALKGEQLIRMALAQVPNLRYGDPYLRLARLHLDDRPEQALADLEEAQKYNQSSCQALYQMAGLYERLNRPEEARRALERCLETYRWLPRFRRKSERRFALLARWRLFLHR